MVLGVGILISLGCCCTAADAGEEATPTDETVAADQLSPLERLKQRSPKERWRQRSSKWLSADQKEPAKPDTESDCPLATPSDGATEQKPIATRTAPSSLPPGAVSPAPASESQDRKSPLLPDKAFLTKDKRLSWPHLVAYRSQDIKKYPEPVRDPDKLKKITEIFPHRQYEPDDKLRKSNPCANLCPRPDGKPCDPEAESPVPTCPEEIQLSGAVFEGRAFSESMFCWTASDVYHNPLYFESPGLERYGHTHGDLIEPFVSVGKFGVQLLGMPYAMTIDPAWKKMYSLGYYRPGECAPKKYYQIPGNLNAALREAGVLTALIFIFP